MTLRTGVGNLISILLSNFLLLDAVLNITCAVLRLLMSKLFMQLIDK